VSVKRLGKGLGALIRSDQNTMKTISQESGSLMKIELKDIAPNPNQPRKTFNESSINELTDSIKEKGLITPITVRQVENGYELVAGERRWRALKKANVQTVPAYIKDVENESEFIEMALIENIQREDLNPLEESEAYEVLNSKYGMAHEAIAKAVGKKRVTISNSLRLLKLPSEIRNSLKIGEISAGHARAILQAKSNSIMNRIWKRVVSKSLTVRQTEIEAKNSLILKKNKRKKINNKIHQVKSIEDQLIEILGARVKLKPSRTGGKIEISYFSNDDLDRIIEIIEAN
tara:strand:+ start:960 stop:1826 length:867 start_codon:yes stop_codon:yes gene_type:complete